jgi:hypothetical protein
MSHADEAIYTCPDCGCYGTAAAFTTHEDAVACSTLMGQLPPPVATYVERYMRMFAPSKRRMTWRRQRRLLEALLPDIEAQRITVQGRDWPAPHSAWIAAIDTVLNSRTVERPLKSNGYLHRILVEIAERAEKAAEKSHEAQRSAGAAERSTAGHSAEMDDAMLVRQSRTALALVTQEAKVNRDRFKTTYGEKEARAFLKSRQFAQAVIDKAVADWLRLEQIGKAVQPRAES